MKKNLLYSTLIAVFLLTSCNDDSDVLLGGGSSTTNNTNGSVTNAKTCSLKEVQINDNGSTDKTTYTYGSTGLITSISNDFDDFTVEYDKTNNISKLYYADDKRNYFEYINDSKGVLTSINMVYFHEANKKTYSVKNAVSFNSSGQITQFGFNFDVLVILFASLGTGDITLTNEVVPINFTYDKSGNVTKIVAVDGTTQEVLLENTEFDTKKNPYSTQSVYRINLLFSTLSLAFGGVNNYNMFNKNNVLKAKTVDEDGKPVTLTYTHTYSNDSYPLKSSILVKDAAGEKKLEESYAYDCK